MTEQRFDIAFSTKEIMREAVGPTTVSDKVEADRALPQRTPAMCVLNFTRVTKLEDVIHVTVDANRT